MAHHQQPAQFQEHFGFGFIPAQSEISRHLLIKLRDSQAGIDNMGGPDAPVEPREHPAQDSRFTSAHLARRDDQPFAVLDPVMQISHQLTMTWSEKDKSRIRRQAERYFAEAEIFQVHIN